MFVAAALSVYLYCLLSTPHSNQSLLYLITGKIFRDCRMFGSSNHWFKLSHSCIQLYQEFFKKYIIEIDRQSINEKYKEKGGTERSQNAFVSIKIIGLLWPLSCCIYFLEKKSSGYIYRKILKFISSNILNFSLLNSIVYLNKPYLKTPGSSDG